MFEKKQNTSLKIEIPKRKKPEDAYWFVYIMFFLLGLVHLLPWNFFVTAQDYWKYKFRDTSYEEVDSTHRTFLQTAFSPSLTISIHVSTIVTQVSVLLWGHKFPVTLKLCGSLFVLLILFIIAAIFIQIDTDAWQTGFFVLTMVITVVVNVMSTIYGMVVYSLLTNFSTAYLGAYLNGQAMAGIFTSCLEILALAVGTSTQATALIYFWIGNSVIILNLILLLAVIKKNQFYQFHAESYKEMKRVQPTFDEIVNITQKIWPGATIMVFWALTNFSLHPSITSLVVSEGEGSGEWSDVYFVPVITFLLVAVGEYIGRTVADRAKIVCKFNISGIWLVVFSGLRMLAFVSLIMLCNAQPRRRLPVVFPHDYQYIIIMVVFSLTSGYLASMSSLIIPRLVPAEKLEVAFHTNIVLIGVLEGAISAVGFFSVDMM